MKKMYINFAFTVIAVFLCGFKLTAADLLVVENGGGGAYATITEAITAAASGDRIFVTPKSGNAAYGENLVIDKSLQLLCNTEGEQFTVQGNITITPANGMMVTIIGMRNLQGNITSAALGAGTRCNVNIMGCTFSNGNLNFDYDNHNITVASTVINGQLSLRQGKVMGNDITTTGCPVVVNSDTYYANDTIWIVGNKLKANYTSATYAGVYWTSTSHFFYIANNYITFGNNYWSNQPSAGIYIYTNKNSTNGRNNILNNTIYFNGNGGYYNNYRVGLIVNTLASTYTDAVNNLILLAPSLAIEYGVYGGTANSTTINYNYLGTGITTPFYSIANDGSNVTGSTSTIDVDGVLAAGSDAINGGNPDSVYYDIDLTRCDVGAYGGSFTLSNFFPITGAARVYFMLAPRRITIGNTLNIKAESFDR